MTDNDSLTKHNGNYSRVMRDVVLLAFRAIVLNITR